jgi:hypothetical protein
LIPFHFDEPIIVKPTIGPIIVKSTTTMKLQEIWHEDPNETDLSDKIFLNYRGWYHGTLHCVHGITQFGATIILTFLHIRFLVLELKYNVSKNPLKETQNPSRYYKNITNLKFQQKPKYHLFKNPHIKIDLLLLLPWG